MIDIKLLREQPELFKQDLEKRKDTVRIQWIDLILNKDKEYREILKENQELRSKRNSISREIAEAKKKGESAEDLLKLASEIPKKVKENDEKVESLKSEIDTYLMKFPNLMHESVPFGEDDEDNVEVATFGEKKKYSFKVKSHADLTDKESIADMPRAAKIAGSRFWYLKGDLALLDMALQKYAIDFMCKKEYTLIQPPFMMNRKAYEGVTDLGDFEDVMYKIDGEDLYLIATSEHPMVSMYMDEILDESMLPIKFVGVSACFRKEAGSHGKDTKGIFRGHQFNKIEQVVLCKPEDSWKLHEEIVKNAVDYWDSLGLHFRKVNICTGDLGTVAAKKYDLEVWMPSQEKYREIVSGSNCTDYQARRLRIRYRTTDEGKQVNKFVHTLNSTCIATSRALTAILEQNQNEDGSITIPEVLQPYMMGKDKIVL